MECSRQLVVCTKSSPARKLTLTRAVATGRSSLPRSTTSTRATPPLARRAERADASGREILDARRRRRNELAARDREAVGAGDIDEHCHETPVHRSCRAAEVVGDVELDVVPIVRVDVARRELVEERASE